MEKNGMERIIKEMNLLASIGNLEKLGKNIAFIAYSFWNELNLIEHKFTVNAFDKTWTVNIPKQTNPYDLISKVVAHGGAYWPVDGKGYLVGTVNTYKFF